MPITRQTRFCDLSVRLAELGGELLGDILIDGADSLNAFRRNAKSQDSCDLQASKAPMIKPDFGWLKFSDLTAGEVESRFNALDGSNQRPRAVFNVSNEEASIKNFEGQNVYFGGLHQVNVAELGELLPEKAEPGAIVWNADVDSERVFVRCKDHTWVFFEEVSLPNLGKLSTPKLISKLLKKKKAKAALQPDGTAAFKFNFI